MECRFSRSSNLSAALAVFLCLLLALGCATPHSIEPGLWELAMEGHIFHKDDVSVGPTYNLIPPTRVDVAVEWIDGEEEAVTLTFVENAPEFTRFNETDKKAAAPITGTITPAESSDRSGKRKVELFGKDNNDVTVLRPQGPVRIPGFEFLLRGTLENPRFVHGMMRSRELFAGFMGMEGDWTLTKVPESD